MSRRLRCSGYYLKYLRNKISQKKKLIKNSADVGSSIKIDLSIIRTLNEKKISFHLGGRKNLSYIFNFPRTIYNLTLIL